MNEGSPNPNDEFRTYRLPPLAESGSGGTRQDALSDAESPVTSPAAPGSVDQPTVLISEGAAPGSGGIEPAAPSKAAVSGDLTESPTVPATPPPALPQTPSPDSGLSTSESPWDSLATPVWVPTVQPSPTSRLGCGARLGIVVALTVALLALALSSLLLVKLWGVGRETAAVLDETIGYLNALCGPNREPVMFPFSQTIHFQGDFTLPEGVVIPFQGSIPINTVVRLVIPGLPGSPTVEIPVQTSVPVDTKVPVPGGIRIPIDTRIPINQDIPLDLCGSASPARTLLEQAITDLKTLRAVLNYP